MANFADAHNSAFMKYISGELKEPSLKRQMSLSPDSEVRSIMRKGTPRVDIINRGSSTRLTPQEIEEEVKKLDQRQKKEISRMRHRGATIYAKSARELQKEIDERDRQISDAKEAKDEDKINELEEEKKELQRAKEGKVAAATFSYRGTRRKRSQSFGGKTKKKLRNKRNSRSKKKRTKGKIKKRKTRRGKSPKRRWSRKYKLTINCKKPKGFSQKQYCKGRLKRKTKIKKKKTR